MRGIGGTTASLQTLMQATRRNGGQASRRLARRLAGRLAQSLHRVFQRPFPGSFGQLLYHRVAPCVKGLPAPSMNVPPRQFERQLAGLLEDGYQVWPLTRLLDAYHGGNAIPPRTLSVTFDDGFESVYVHAWPIVERLRVPVTIFLATGFVNDEQPFYFDEWASRFPDRIPAESYRPLRARQCREMADSPLVTFGTHGHCHLDWRGRPDEFRDDLARSIQFLRDLLGEARIGDRVLFAFPFGKPRLGFVEPRLIEAARRVGVVCGLTTASVPVLPGSDPFGWGRFNVYAEDDASTLAAKLDGWYGGLGLRRAVCLNGRGRAVCLSGRGKRGRP